MAELEFVKKKGTLRYLEHLEANKEVEDCPICQQKPEEKVRTRWKVSFIAK